MGWPCLSPSSSRRQWEQGWLLLGVLSASTGAGYSLVTPCPSIPVLHLHEDDLGAACGCWYHALAARIQHRILLLRASRHHKPAAASSCQAEVDFFLPLLIRTNPAFYNCISEISSSLISLCWITQRCNCAGKKRVLKCTTLSCTFFMLNPFFLLFFF